MGRISVLARCCCVSSLRLGSPEQYSWTSSQQQSPASLILALPPHCGSGYIKQMGCCVEEEAGNDRNPPPSSIWLTLKVRDKVMAGTTRSTFKANPSVDINVTVLEN
jgi:hypothetical protein